MERAVRGAEMAKDAADEMNDQAAACELEAIVDAISDIPDCSPTRIRTSSSIYEERAPEVDDRVVDAVDIEDNDNDVAGYLAVGPSTSDSVIDGFIAAVGLDRVLAALDRLTAPAEADLAN